jgi:hypothetical protein
MKIRELAIVAGLVCVLALVAAGCGGGGGDSGSTDTQSKSSGTGSNGGAKKTPTTLAGKRDAAAKTIKGRCEAKRKSGKPLSKADKAAFHRAVAAYAAAYKKRPNAAQSGKVTVRDVVMTLSSGLLNQCHEPLAARRLVVALAAKPPKTKAKPGSHVNKASGAILAVCTGPTLSKADKAKLGDAVHQLASAYKVDRDKAAGKAEQQVLVTTALKLMTTCHEPAAAGALLDSARPPAS